MFVQRFSSLYIDTLSSVERIILINEKFFKSKSSSDIIDIIQSLLKNIALLKSELKI